MFTTRKPRKAAKRGQKTFKFDKKASKMVKNDEFLDKTEELENLVFNQTK